MYAQIIAKVLGLKRKDFVIARIVLLVLIYAAIFQANKWVFVGLIVPFWGFTIYAYTREKARTKNVRDSFEDDNLFFRYGNPLSYEYFPLPVNNGVDDQELNLTLQELEEELVHAIRDKIDYRITRGKHKTENIVIHDRNLPTDSRNFTRFSYKGLRGGEINLFLLYEVIGSYIILHFDAYFKGIPHWYDKVYFLLSSPYKIWFWIIPWLRNDYSVLTKISQYLDNSFESYDLRTYVSASRLTILDTLKDFLEKKGLLTPELEQILNLNFIANQNVVNGNQTNISGSNTILGGISQAIK